jgi:SAM-dependent methyltransferase
MAHLGRHASDQRQANWVRTVARLVRSAVWAGPTCTGRVTSHQADAERNADHPRTGRFRGLIRVSASESGASGPAQRWHDACVRSFDSAADEYDAARPSYPPGIYDTLESLSGGLADKVVGDGGAGTGVVSRQLRERDAVVIAFDPGAGMLRRALRRTPELRALVAEAGAIPFQSHVLDVLCFGQSWHWVQQDRGAQEAARVLKPGGWWAAWWNHPWADSEEWFDAFCTQLETRCSGYSRHSRDVDWCSEAIGASGFFLPAQRHIVSWERRVTIEDWLIDLSSHSYIIDLGERDASALMADVESIVRHAFAGSIMTVPYQTRLWAAQLP